MRTINPSRRKALKLLTLGSVGTLITGCEVLDSLPRGSTGIGSRSSTDGKQLSDDVSKALRNHPDTARLQLRISSEADEVIVKGFVNSRMEWANAEIIANQVPGVRHVLMDVYIQ